MSLITETYEIIESQLCRRCKVEKPLDNFHKDSNRISGIKIYCNECCILNNRESKHRPKTNTLKYKKHGFAKGTTEYIEHTENVRLKSTYGITIERYNEMFTSQNGCCAICNIHQSKLKRGIHIDHDHNTKEVRGLLCQNCNTAIGLFKENIETLKNSIVYLNNANKNVI